MSQNSSSPTQWLKHGSLYPLSRDSRAPKDLQTGHDEQTFVSILLGRYSHDLAQIIRGICRPIMQSADGDFQLSVNLGACWPVSLKSGPETEVPRLADINCRIGRALLTAEADDRSIRSLLVLWSTSTANTHNTAHSCSSWQTESLRRQMVAA